jgi:hypothetical protein
MKYLKEYAFWNKDSITADGILKEMDTLKGSDIEKLDAPDSTYKFNLKGFEILITYKIGIMDVPWGHFIVKVDDVKIDCSWNQGRKIYNKAKNIYLYPKNQEEEFVKKDAKIAFGKK